MPTYVRWREDGACYFFTVVTYRRRTLFRDADCRRILHDAFVEVRKRWPFEMDACVLLPNHLHCIWTMPASNDDFPIRWANIKRLFTKSYLSQGGQTLPVSESRNRRDERGVWQPRYWEHRIRNEKEYGAYRDYIHLNPVKHGYVQSPVDWPWSSVHRQLGSGELEPDWTAWSPIQVDVGE